MQFDALVSLTAFECAKAERQTEGGGGDDDDGATMERYCGLAAAGVWGRWPFCLYGAYTRRLRGHCSVAYSHGTY